MKTWTAAIKGIEKVPEKVVRGTVMGMFTRIVKRSPVDTGRFRANWQITINSPASGQVSATDKSGKAEQNPSTTPSGSMTAVNGAVFVQRNPLPSSAYYITNNLPYAERLEYGYSPQMQAGGMVRRSLTEFEQVMKDAIKKL